MDHHTSECRERGPALIFSDDGSKFLLYGDWVQAKYKMQASVVSLRESKNKNKILNDDVLRLGDSETRRLNDAE